MGVAHERRAGCTFRTLRLSHGMVASVFRNPFRKLDRRRWVRGRLYGRQVWRLGVIVAVAMLGGVAGAGFAWLSDAAMKAHSRLYALNPWLTLLLLPIGFGVAAWLTRRFAPEAAGSGIPQVIAAAEQRWTGRWGGQRVTLKTAAWKVVLSAALFVCGASIGREGPTVQVVAGILRSLTRGLKGGPGRRALILAGGAAGVAAAFNTPIAGVVFAVEELAKSFEKRTHATVILVVVVAGFTSYAIQGDYAYFGVQGGKHTMGMAWLLAPVIGFTGGLSAARSPSRSPGSPDRSPTRSTRGAARTRCCSQHCAGRPRR